VAGRRDGIIFSNGALKRIYKYSRGLPRLINAACDRALLAGYTRDTIRISSRIAAAGIKDMRGDTASHAYKRRFMLIPTLIILMALLSMGIYYKRHLFIDLINVSRYLWTTEGVTSEELSHAMASELKKIPESESARRAFNILAGLWNVTSVSGNGNFTLSNAMERAALERALHLYRFSGNLGALLRIDYPAVLELTMPDIPGKRFVSLVGMKNEKILVDPPMAGRISLSFREIEKHWTGQGVLLWKDPLNLLRKIPLGSKGDSIKQLQDLLREAGTDDVPLTGVYDGNTLSAVKRFQSSRGIEPDGIVGAQTLMLLYRSVDRFKVPRLSGGRK
jgi:general secretion pathway protein A